MIIYRIMIIRPDRNVQEVNTRIPIILIIPILTENNYPMYGGWENKNWGT